MSQSPAVAAVDVPVVENAVVEHLTGISSPFPSPLQKRPSAHVSSFVAERSYWPYTAVLLARLSLRHRALGQAYCDTCCPVPGPFLASIWPIGGSAFVQLCSVPHLNIFFKYGNNGKEDFTDVLHFSYFVSLHVLTRLRSSTFVETRLNPFFSI